MPRQAHQGLKRTRCPSQSRRRKKTAGKPFPPKPPKKEPVSPPKPKPEREWIDIPEDVRLWPVVNARGHVALVRRALFLPDGKRVLTASYDKTVRIWDVETGEPLTTFRLPVGPNAEGMILAADVSPDGKRLAVAGVPFGMGKYGLLVHIVDMEQGRVEKTLRGHTNIVNSVDFSDDGKLLATCSSDKTALIFDTQTWRLLHTLEGHAKEVRDVRFAPDGKHLATASFDKTARIWSVENGKMLHELVGHADACVAVTWSFSSKLLVTGSTDGEIRLWTADGQLRKTFRPFQGNGAQLTSVKFAPDGQRVLYTGNAEKNLAGILDLVDGETKVRFEQHTNTIVDGQFSPDGQLAVSTGGNDHETFIWKTDDGSLVQKLQSATRTIWGTGWGPDGKTIAWGHVNLGNLVKATTQLEYTLNLESLEFGPLPKDGDTFHRAVLERNGYSLDIIDYSKLNISKNGTLLHTITPKNPGDRIYCASMVDDKHAVVGGMMKMFLLDVESGKAVRQYTDYHGLVLAVSPSPDGKYFLSGGTEQVLRIWHPERTTPLLSILVADRDWVAWTGEGYYAASPNGERMIGWQVNHGPDRLATFYPAVRFERTFHRPEVIRQLLPSGTLDQALLSAKVPRRRLNDVVPPLVEIVQPDPGMTFAADTIELRARAKNVRSEPVTGLRLLVDGRPYPGANIIFANPQPGEVAGNWHVTLPQGRHQLAVQAESASSVSLSRVVQVTRRVEEKDTAGKLYVLAVGIADYGGVQKFPFAAEDARKIAESFEKHSPGVFAAVETKVLTNDSATRKGMLAGLEWLRDKATTKDTAVFFFAGGGQQVKSRLYLLPVDASEKKLIDTAVADDEVQAMLAQTSGRLLVLLDVRQIGVANEAPIGLTDRWVRRLISSECGAIVFASAQGRESPHDSPDVKHGSFAFSIIEGLSGLADVNRDRIVHLHELAFYSSPRTSQLTGGKQHPIFARPEWFRSFPLTKVEQ
ncbi:MAG: hypothetical protein KatS3mg105_2481 [Gemmatales bacterium]|nr:MAG: hypothetical protein KatS3mg105_2481 [Gemmatales bacterium]